MFLALREIRRGVVRFALLAVAVGLLLFLVLFQQALQNGLITGFVGGLRNQVAPVLVYSVDGQRTLQGSVLAPPALDAAAAVDGVAASARLFQSTFTMSRSGGDPFDAAVVGSDDAELGQPRTLSAGRRPASPGEAVGSNRDFAIGDVVDVARRGEGGPVAITIVGLADDIQLSVTPTLFTDADTYARVARSVNPAGTAPLANALVLRPAADVSPTELARRVNDAVADTDTVTQATAADTAPGVAQVRQSFGAITFLYGFVVPLVTGLFFLIITLQKRRALVLLRAIGAPAAMLARSLVWQVLLVTVTGIVVGVGLYAAVARGRVGGLSLRYDPFAVGLWSALFVVLSLVGALGSLRRVLRVDPIEATSGATR